MPDISVLDRNGRQIPAHPGRFSTDAVPQVGDYVTLRDGRQCKVLERRFVIDGDADRVADVALIIDYGI